MSSSAAGSRRSARCSWPRCARASITARWRLSTRHLDIQYTPLGGQAGVVGAGALAMQESLQLHGGKGMSLAVEFRDVVKNFGPVQVLHGVSFSIAPGRVLGLIGENGAGKSTLMKILSGYVEPSGGEILVDGRPQQLSQFARSRSAGDSAHSPGIQPGRRPDHRPEHLPRSREDPRLDPRRGRDARRHGRRVAPGRAGCQSRHPRARPDRRGKAAGGDRQGAGPTARAC